MRYAYALTAALLLGGTAASMALQPPAGAQVAQNEPGTITASAPRAGAPMSFADMVAKLQPAVVNISTTQRVTLNQQQNPFAGTPFGDLFGFGQGQGGAQGGAPVTREAQSLGSGFLISADGYVVTNNHVVSAGGGERPGQRGIGSAVVESITVTLPDRREFKARLIGRDPASDLALLKIDGANLPFVRFGDSAATRVGDWVVAIGNPFGLGSTVTAGIVSAVHRITAGGGAGDRFIQTDASINQGNSGGPMFDLNGNVIGINSQIFSPTGGNVGIGFAIPAEEAKPVIDTLMKGRSVARGYLGVGIQSLDDGIASALGLPKNRGELISRVEAAGPAEKAGLKQGDVVVKVGGRDVTPDTTLSYLVANQAPGSRVPLSVIRDGKPLTLTATVGTRPSEEQLAQIGGGQDEDGLPDQNQPTQPAANPLGVQVVPLTPQIARSQGFDATVRGVIIAQVDPSSDAAQKGLQRADVISSVDRTPVTTPAELAAALSAARAAKRDTVLLYFQRAKRGGLYVAVKLK
ncbi:Do family serine endopeptidase [Sphingomonas donggukensis]|uniref:Probable periplasmic serine endoprotease DegP-like n=1 Tax=Sphingomonas donggukensis TaxID=2949093 RepID=A0ABY4TSJ5_9SPHN|nr:Do family serine endopeptidase [Sphingomonas donggukensis]URW75365.1 Do family serine endopeptidase [Sphingomonas donggukensis]